MLIAAAVTVPAVGVSFAIDRTHPAWVAFFFLAVFLVFAGMVSDLVGEHVFLLDPHRYGGWLRNLGPYEPATVWEQFGNGTATKVGGTGLLVLGIVVGAYLGPKPGSSNMTFEAIAWIGYLVMFAAPLWWAVFIVRLGTLHRRAIRQGILPVRCPRRFGLFWLFTAFWVIGLMGVALLVWGVRLYLHVMYGIAFS